MWSSIARIWDFGVIEVKGVCDMGTSLDPGPQGVCDIAVESAQHPMPTAGAGPVHRSLTGLERGGIPPERDGIRGGEVSAPGHRLGFRSAQEATAGGQGAGFHRGAEPRTSQRNWLTWSTSCMHSIRNPAAMWATCAPPPE